MTRRQLPPVARELIRVGAKFTLKKAEEKLKPPICQAVLLASSFGILPKERFVAEKTVRCSYCRKKKKGRFLRIDIVLTEGELFFCRRCEETLLKKVVRGKKK